jgi:hypothetical protein
MTIPGSARQRDPGVHRDQDLDGATSPITVKRHIGADDALRTGSYSQTVTFTLSTAAPRRSHEGRRIGFMQMSDASAPALRLA